MNQYLFFLVSSLFAIDVRLPGGDKPLEVRLPGIEKAIQAAVERLDITPIIFWDAFARGFACATIGFLVLWVLLRKR